MVAPRAPRAPRASTLAALAALATLACQSQPPAELARAEPAPAKAEPTTKPTPAAQAPQGKLALGAPIEGGEKASLVEVAAAPMKFANKTLVMEGTVSAVCQHRGCWMELKDDRGEAHVKMAGHAFFVPRTASGKRARVLGRLAGDGAEAACGGEHGGGAGCKAEAQKQLGRPLAKLELEAQGVEIFD